MTMREIFSKNLERLCATQKSHAHVARELGLNRQQFASYVKGKYLPNETVIEKICAYFQVDIGTLFREHSPVTEFEGIDALIDCHKKQFDRIINDEISSRDRGLADGFYYIYFAVPDDPDSFTCSLLAIRREGGLTTFKRISRAVTARLTLRPRTLGIHSGFVVFREGLLFFLGVGMVQGGSPSMLVAHPIVSPEIPYVGQAIVHAGSTFHIVKFCITAVSKRVKIWKTMRSVRLLSRTELLNISPKVHAYFDAKNI